MSETSPQPAEASLPEQERPSASRWLLGLILIAYLLLGVTYALATPPLEASDEYKHYPFVQHVQTTGRLPILLPEAPGRWLQEAAQPPLYYLAMAALTWPIDTEDLPDVHWVNKYAFVGDPNQVANKNLIIHQPENEAFPWHGSVLAVYIIRLASLGLGMVTVLLVAKLGALIAGRRVALLAAALTAFNPMFLFVHAAVNNDSLAILLGTLGLYLLVKIWRNAADPQMQWRRYLTLGIVMGLGLLTKLSLGGLLGLALLALAWQAWRKREWRFLWQGGLWLLLPALLLPAAWFWRNLQLYGDPTGLNVFVAVQDQRETIPGWADWMGEFGTLYRSFWGLFGGVNVAAPEWVYRLLNLFAGLGVVGLAYWLWRRRVDWRRVLVDSGLWLLIAWPLIVFVLLLRWNLYAASFQGRLLFPAIAALNVLWAMGLLNPLPASWSKRAAPALATGMLLIALVLPWIAIRPAYVRPEPLDSVPASASFGPISFYSEGEEVLRLVGVEAAPGQRVSPGAEPVEVTLYWQAVQPIPQAFLSTVSLLGRDYAPAAHVNRHPASGMIPTSLWQPGEIWRDVYYLYPDVEAAAPAVLRVRASIYDSENEVDLMAAGQDGATLDLLLVGEAALVANEPQAPEVQQEVALAEGISLQGYSLDHAQVVSGRPLAITLFWGAEATPALDYTVFVHLLDANGEQIAGADSPPVNGDYVTSLWRAGDLVDDKHMLILPEALPPGDYRIVVGLYDPGSGQRLARRDGEGDSIIIPIQIAPVEGAPTD